MEQAQQEILAPYGLKKLLLNSESPTPPSHGGFHLDEMGGSWDARPIYSVAPRPFFNFFLGGKVPFKVRQPKKHGCPPPFSMETHWASEYMAAAQKVSTKMALWVNGTKG